MVNEPNRVGGTLERIDHYPDHLQAIGLVITEFSRLEGSLCLVLWELIQDPVRADAVYWSLGSNKARCDVIRGVTMEAFSDEKWRPVREAILALIESARKVGQKRNDIAHGEWGTPARVRDNPFVCVKRPATKNAVFERYWSVAELQALADEISRTESQAGFLTTVLMFINEPRTREHTLSTLRGTPNDNGLEMLASLRKFLEPLQMDHLLD